MTPLYWKGKMQLLPWTDLHSEDCKHYSTGLGWAWLDSPHCLRHLRPAAQFPAILNGPPHTSSSALAQVRQHPHSSSV